MTACTAGIGSPASGRTRMRLAALLTALAGLLLVRPAPPVAAQDDHEPMLVGAPRCKMCHGQSTGDQWSVWEDSAHARAWEALATPQARAIAEERGLADAQQAPECLRCHATTAFLGEGCELAPNNSYALSEGVGCEACHGPGSKYMVMSVMRNRARAIENGLWLNGGAEHCQKCHNEQSPTFEGFDHAEFWARIAHPIPDGRDPGGE
ncbi:MAG: cytochrome c family protein [Candidatus Krumholzibacteriia bacterium]